ncbi:ABC transporter permease [Nocardia sp. IBHARD005]|uniref:ABC transporter permease n=1 Tax=Nocardia sp. IBHARD005 TaxID=3457765 RepID=UPI00405A33F6
MASLSIESEPALTSKRRFPSPSPSRWRRENSIHALLVQTLVQTRQLLLRWSRDPIMVLQALVFPALLLVILNTVLGRQISAFAGHDALYGSVPMVTLVAAMSGATAGAVALGRDRDHGWLARLWVLPVHRASGLTARIAAEIVRIAVTTLVIVCTGFALGFRFQQGIPAAAAWLLVPVLFGTAYATFVTAVAVHTAETTLVEGVTLISSLLMFFCTGFVPLAAYPPWAQPLVEHQPMTYAIETMRGLALGGAVRGPLTGIVLWTVGAIAVFAIPAVRGYRRASRR